MPLSQANDINILYIVGPYPESFLEADFCTLQMPETSLNVIAARISSACIKATTPWSMALSLCDISK